MSYDSYQKNLKELKMSVGVALGSCATGFLIVSAMQNVGEGHNEKVENLRETAHKEAGPLFDTIYAPSIPNITSLEMLEQLSTSEDPVRFVAVCMKDQWTQSASPPSFDNGTFSLSAQQVVVDEDALKDCFQKKYAAADPAAKKANNVASSSFLVLGTGLVLAAGFGIVSTIGAGLSGVRTLRDAANNDLPPVSTMRRFSRYIKSLE